MTAWELTNISAQLLLPPGGLIVLALAGLALVRSHAKAGVAIAATALVSLLLLATPNVSRALLRTLEDPNVDATKDRSVDAIVVLGGGVYRDAPEYSGPAVRAETLERLRYAAHLQHRTGKPVLVTGGDPAGYKASEGEQMKIAMKDFGVTVRWVEGASANTAENARMSRKMLKQAGIDSILLVTHAWHMPRAKMAFQNAGLRVVPAAMGFTPPPELRLIYFIPHAQALLDSWRFFHEIAGIAWYRLKFARER